MININKILTLHALALLLEQPARHLGGLRGKLGATLLEGDKEGEALGGVDREGVVYTLLFIRQPEISFFLVSRFSVFSGFFFMDKNRRK